MLKSVGVVLSPVKMGVNTLEKPTVEIKQNASNIDVSKKSWTFFKKSKSSKLHCEPVPSVAATLVATEVIKTERIFVDQEQQYDENDIPQYFHYEESKRLSYHPSPNLPSTSSNESYNSSISSTYNKEKSQSCDLMFLNSQDPCYIHEEQQNEQIFLNNLNFNRNSLIIRDSLRNHIKIEISYNPSTIDNGADDADTLSYVTAASNYNRRNYRSNANGETILNINGFNDSCDVPKRNSLASSCDTSGGNRNFMRRKLTAQSRTLIPLSSSELAKEEWRSLEDDENRENNNSSNQVNINLVNPFTSAPSKSTNVVTINLNSTQPQSAFRKSQISLDQNSQQPSKSPTTSFDQTSQSTLDNHRKHTPDLLSSRIDLFSILNRRDEDQLFHQSRNRIQTQNDSDVKNFKYKKNTEILRNTQRKLVSNSFNSSSNNNSHSNYTASTNANPNSTFRRSQLTLCDRLSGSFQNLSNRIKVNTKKLSASESNLVKLQQMEVSKKSTATKMRYSDTFTGEYCPSVLYSKSKRNSKMGSENSLNIQWKKYIPKIFKTKRPKSGRELQDLDDGFFEKFGSLLRQKSEYGDDALQTPLAPMPENSEEDNAVALENRMETIDEAEIDDQMPTVLQSESDPDSETDDTEQKQMNFIDSAVGWNIEELYEEILYEVMHNVGCELDSSLSQSTLFNYIQDAFKITNNRHDEILKLARSKEAPEIRLDVECVEGKELHPKDPNGLSDPFVTMFLASAPTHRYNTSVKSETLNPMWEEHFSLPISENPNNESLVLEVWDFDPAESVKEKMTKISDVKGVKGLRKLMKEIAVTATSGKHDNELIGRTTVPLKSIPASGLDMWYSLDKKGKLKSQGMIKIRLNFSSEKNSHVAAQEHRHLLRVLLMHELESSKVAEYWWAGKFSEYGEAVLIQHSAQSGLSQTDLALAKWSTFTAIHENYPLSFVLFDSLLDKIIKPIQSLSISQDEVKFFWEGAKKVLPSCLGVIRKVRKHITDKQSVRTLKVVLNIISKIAMLEPPEGTDLFPANVYGWLTRENNDPNWDISNAVNCAITTGANDWFTSKYENIARPDPSEEDKLSCLVQMIQLVRSDLQRSIEFYDKIFQEILNFQLAKMLYIIYEARLADVIKPIVQDVVRALRRINLPKDKSLKINESEEVNMGTTLFELYLVLKKFLLLGTALAPGETQFKLSESHSWFTGGVSNWLDISVLKALTRIEKAIELDDLVPVDDSVKYSSSAVDTLAIFYQIKIFWQQLAWPDVEDSFMFVGKIVDDICQCCDFYADKMAIRVEGLGEVENIYEKKFEVTREWCLAINNIDYIRQSLTPFVKELGVDDIINRLADYRSPMEAQRCEETLKNVIENAMDTERNKILELIERVARKMSPPMRKFLTEGAEFFTQDSNSMDRLMLYLESSLCTLNSELNEVNFERMLDAIWSELAEILEDLVRSNLDKRRPPAFFDNLRRTLELLVDNFKGVRDSNNSKSDGVTLDSIKRLLVLHAYETSALIHQYHLERMREQNNMPESKYGVLTVRCGFKGEVLEIEVMSARNIIPMDTNGTCDPFVRIHLLPDEKFAGVVKPKTNVQNKTLFPLFDEKFCINLSPEQRKTKDALILFSVKDKDLFGMSNQYIAECYLQFDDIENGASNQQKHLNLTRPTNLATDCINALEFRQGDKLAKEFLKKLKQKINA